MMLVVSGVAALALSLAERNAGENVERELRREFHARVAGLDRLQQIRRAALVERCHALVRRPRIHAALEDNALDLLYPSAKDELRDVMQPVDDQGFDQEDYILRALFYRFLDSRGQVIPPPNLKDVGVLTPEEEAQLALSSAPESQQTGYIVMDASRPGDLCEVVAMPIISTETGEGIATIVLGFKMVGPIKNLHFDPAIKLGIWVRGRLHQPPEMGPIAPRIEAEIARAIATSQVSENNFGIQIDGTPHLVFYNLFNPGSRYAPAYGVCIYPLTELVVRQRRLRWQVLGAGVLLFFGGLIASHFISRQFSLPVEKLAIDSAENWRQRQRAEAALEMTSAELQRAARFSADASHQLKTPVTVLRAGLEELLARPNLTADECYEISALVHQTYRLASVIEDLLLLSKIDAGRLRLDFAPVNLSQLIEGWLDDLAALPDPLELSIETNFPENLYVAGEKRYTTLILQNLLENARKYNRRGGRIRVKAWTEDEVVFLTIGNTADPIPASVREHIFERFHRGVVGENVSGHGLGLNLARELARIHKGDLRLARSDEEWTEFEVRFQRAQPVRVNSLSSVS